MAPIMLLLFAALASLAVGAPAKTLRKRTFAIPAQGFIDPAKAISRANRKWGTGFSPALIAAEKVPITQTVTATVAVTTLTSSLSSTLASIPTSPSFLNGTPPTGTFSDAASTAGSGEVVASPEAGDKAYLSPVTIGDQTLDLDFDTGSADLWVFSSRLSPSEIGQHTAYDPSKSSTWQEYSGASWNITYGDESHALGSVGFDRVAVGGVSFPQQCIELATDVSDEFTQDVQSDGLLGLGFSNINTVQPQPQKTFFENIMDSLDLPLFTADLDKNAAGTYEFGRIDSTSYVGDISYAPIVPGSGFWEFESKAFAVGNVTTKCPKCNNAIADTGTSLMMMNNQVVRAYYAQVPGAAYDSSVGGYTYACDAALPDFSIAIGAGYMATVKGEDMTYMPLETDSDSQCFGGLQTVSADVQILGDMFLKSYFAVFDGGNMRFGVAKKA